MAVEDHRYEVRCKCVDSEEDHVVGRTDDPSGGRLVADLELHPYFHSPRVIERKPEKVE
jgi:hypothetical protein